MQHLWELIIFLAILLGPLPLCLSLILITESGQERPTLSHCVLVLLVGWCIIETCIGLLLGIVQRLTLSAVLMSELFSFLAGITFYAYIRRHIPSFSFRNLLRLSQPLSNIKVLILGAIFFVGASLLERLVTQPIFEYDSLAYHLPVMAKWYQEASFTMLDQLHQISRYPYNWEVLCTLFLMPFREDFLVACPNLIAWALLGLAVYLLSIKIGASRIYSMASSFLVLTLPILIEQVNTMRVDIPFAAFFMVSLYFVVLYDQTQSFSYFALLLATLGMLCGIKTSGLVYGFLLVAVLTLMRVRSILLHKSKNSIFRLCRFAIPFGVASVFCLLLLGGFWYLRNLIEIGNPIGYINIQIGDVVIFPGNLKFTERIRRTTLASLFELTNPLHWKVLVEQVNIQLHVPFMAMTLQALLLPLTFVAGQRRTKKEHLMGLVILLIGTGFLYWITPYSGDNGQNQWQITPWIGGPMRYAFPFMAVLGITAATGASTVQIRDECIMAIVMFSLGSIPGTSILYVALYMVFALLLNWRFFGVIGRIISIASVPRKGVRLAGRVVITTIFAGVIVATTFVAREVRDVRRSEVYGDVFEYTTTNVSRDEVVGYLASHRSYFLYGKGLNRRVLYVPSESDDFSEWVDVLQERKVSIVAIGPLRETWKSRREVGWLENTGGPFVRILGQDPNVEPVLYRLKSSPSP